MAADSWVSPLVMQLDLLQRSAASTARETHKLEVIDWIPGDVMAPIVVEFDYITI
jgi:hypothetical protein